MTVNLPLLRKAVEWAEAEAAKPDQRESEWNQEWFAEPGSEVGRTCGTTYCIAGYVRSLFEGHYSGWDYGQSMTAEFAAKRLGISEAEHNPADGLFAADNTIEDVRRIAEQIAAQAGERL